MVPIQSACLHEAKYVLAVAALTGVGNARCSIAGAAKDRTAKGRRARVANFIFARYGRGEFVSRGNENPVEPCQAKLLSVLWSRSTSCPISEERVAGQHPDTSVSARFETHMVA